MAKCKKCGYCESCGRSDIDDLPGDVGKQYFQKLEEAAKGLDNAQVVPPLRHDPYAPTYSLWYTCPNCGKYTSGPNHICTTWSGGHK